MGLSARNPNVVPLGMAALDRLHPACVTASSNVTSSHHGHSSSLALFCCVYILCRLDSAQSCTGHTLKSSVHAVAHGTHTSYVYIYMQLPGYTLEKDSIHTVTRGAPQID